jgi:hypothetical protein
MVIVFMTSPKYNLHPNRPAVTFLLVYAIPFPAARANQGLSEDLPLDITI